MNINEAIEFLRANRFTTDTHGRVETEAMNLLMAEVERLRAIEGRAQHVERTARPGEDSMRTTASYILRGARPGT